LIRVRLTVVDSGGHATTDVYKYTKARQPRVFSIKGVGGIGKTDHRPSEHARWGRERFPAGARNRHAEGRIPLAVKRRETGLRLLPLAHGRERNGCLTERNQGM
jgi:hypothetical protein